MKKYLHFSRFLVLLVGLLTLSANSAWGETTTLFHETFGDNSGSARDWKESYSVKSGIEAVFQGITGYTITNAKQSKNTVGQTTSGLAQSSMNTDAVLIIGPLNVSSYSDLTLSYYWKAGSTKGTYSTSVYYATSSTATYTEVTKTSGTGATTFVECKYSLPTAAQVSTLYLKIVWNTSNTQAVIDEVDLTGAGSSGGVTYTDYLTECESCNPVSEELSVTAQATTLTIGSNDQASTTLSTAGGNGGTVKYSVTPNTATITGNSITFTAAGTYIVTASQEKTADGKCSQSAPVTITVNPRQYTLTFVDRGNTHTTQQHIAGEKATKPAAPTGVCTEPINYEFVGWAEETVDAQNTYSEVNFDTYTMPAKDTQLYAVYRYAEDGALRNDFEMISSVEELESGADYVIAAYANSSDYALKNVVNTDGKAESVSVVCDENNVITTTDNTIIWKIAGNSTEGYTFYNNACKKYIDLCLDGTYVILNLTESPTYKYKITMTSTAGGTGTSITSTLENTYNVFSYYNSLFNAYKSCNYNIYLYKRAVASKYTTSPTCGPHIGLSGDVRITSAKDVRVDAYTKITVSGTNLNKNTGGNGGTATAVSIKATSNNANFKIKRWGTKGDGTASSLTLATNISDATYSDSLCITYTPNAANTTESATITLTAYRYNGTTVYATNTITVQGHSLPERFVIAAKGESGWVALPNTLASNSSDNVQNVEDINGYVDPTDNPTKLNTAPSNVIYTAAARGDSYKNNSQTGLRFTVDGGQFLQASKNETKVWLSTTGSQDMQSWTLRTEDFTDYEVRLDSGMVKGRYLAYNKSQDAERIGHYTTNTAIRFLPFDTECTRLLAPANLKVTQVKSSSVTLTWDAVTGATGYAYSTDDGNTWTEMGNVLTYTITGLTAEKAYTILVKGVVPAGDTDCSYYGTVSATTTNCEDVPYDISYTSDVNSITLTWAMSSNTATVQIFSDADGKTQVGGDYTGKTSPCTITGLTKATTYYVKISAGGTCPSELVEVSTERPQLDVVEWKPNGIDVAINTNEKISVVLENQVTKGTGTGNVAEDLFFSKYFEAHSTNKMLGIYNGTPNRIALADYSIAISSEGEFSLSRFGKEAGYIDAGEEIILVQYSSVNSAKVCAQEQEGWDTWFETQSSGGEGLVMQMSGRQSLGLYKNSVLIDIIGSSTNSNGLGNLNELDKNSCSTSKLSIDGIVVNDAPSFFSMQGDNISTEVIETDYALTTNRCLLVRKNSVTSGKNAVLENVTTSDVCAEISASFVTLGEEWMGLRIGSGKSSDTEIQEATCTGLSYLGHFDYSGYYTTYDSLTTVEFDNSKRNPDGTLTINIPGMDTLACKGLKIIAADESGNVLTTKEYRVPILVSNNTTTADKDLFHFGGDTCKNCDVVVRNKATLTKDADGKDQVRDVMVYEGSSLKVNEGTTFTVNSLSLRRREDAVAVADVAGTLNLSSTSDKPVYLDMRINAENWHWFTLPYDCAIADVTWSNGQPAEYGKDWFLMYYDGESRATGVDSGNWKEYTGNTIAAGQGFIIGIKGDGNDKHAYELRFPMAKEVITKDGEDKTVPVYAYGAGTEVRPNHKGWNLVGNPYLNYYKKGNINSFVGLRLGLLEYDAATGWWDVAENDNQPYIVIPQNFGWSAYQQVLVSSRDLLPFTSYFIQVGKDTGYTNGQQCEVQFDKDQRGKSAKAALMTSAAEEAEEEPVITGIVLRNAQGEEDETSLVIAERFGSSYEMGADFFKWFGDYYKYYTLPVLYSIGDDGGKRAFNAVNEAGAKQSIPLGMYAARDGEYTFSLNTRSDLSRVDKVWLYDAESGLYTDLLREDYTFATTRTEGSGRFFLSVVLKEKEITTGASDVRYGDLRLSTDKQTLVVRGLPEAAEVWVYDPSGKLLHHEQTRHYERHYAVPQQGTYLVRVESNDGAVTLRGVCR